MNEWMTNTIAINVDENDVETIEKRARAAAKGDHRYVYLVSWWNRRQHLGGPPAAMIETLPEAARDYAEARGADVRVSVNGDDYVFYYVSNDKTH